MKTFNEYLINEQEKIKISVIYTTGNSNRKLTPVKLSKIEAHELLSNPENITDDEIFKLSNGKKVFIEDIESNMVEFDGKIYQL